MMRHLLLLTALALTTSAVRADEITTAPTTKEEAIQTAAPAQDTPAATEAPTTAEAPKAEALPTATTPIAEAPAPAVQTWTHSAVDMPADGNADIYIIPIHEEIGKTNKFILRRGLKEAISKKAEVVVLDMDTPGGRVDIMLEMMEMVDRYEGRTIAYVNHEAVSAGALISASASEIYFAPKSVMGAAAVINSSGEDIPHTLKTKIDSYMDARLRAITANNPRRADVIRAMMQEDYVLQLDGKTIKDKGILLSLTSDEAIKLYGTPASPILSSGTYASVEALAKAEYGEGHYTIKTYKMTWSETAAMYMEKISPILIGLGFLCLIVEFYTPGFGLPGISGIVLLAIVFLSNFMAGLAGYEPAIIFAIGFLLLMLELLLFPGVMFAAITGGLLMLGSLIWSLADIWPKSGGGIEIDFTRIVDAAWEVAIGLILAIVVFALLYKLLPKRIFFDKFVLAGASGNTPASEPIVEASASNKGLPAIGSIGTATSNLRPSGNIEIDGVPYEATLTVGSAERGQKVVVTGYRDFHLLVQLKN